MEALPFHVRRVCYRGILLLIPRELVEGTQHLRVCCIQIMSRTVQILTLTPLSDFLPQHPEGRLGQTEVFRCRYRANRLREIRQKEAADAKANRCGV